MGRQPTKPSCPVPTQQLANTRMLPSVVDKWGGREKRREHGTHHTIVGGRNKKIQNTERSQSERGVVTSNQNQDDTSTRSWLDIAWHCMALHGIPSHGLTCLVEVHEVKHSSCYQRLLGVDQRVQQPVHPLVHVQRGRAHGLRDTHTHTQTNKTARINQTKSGKGTRQRGWWDEREGSARRGGASTVPRKKRKRRRHTRHARVPRTTPPKKDQPGRIEWLARKARFQDICQIKAARTDRRGVLRMQRPPLLNQDKLSPPPQSVHSHPRRHRNWTPNPNLRLQLWTQFVLCNVVYRIPVPHLLSHGALVRVPRTLVVVRVGDEAGHHPQQREGVDLEVRVVEG